MASRSNSWKRERNVPLLDRQIWQLTHLVNVATNELSPCLSLNTLLREARTQHRNGDVEIYISAMSHSRASLSMYVNNINELRRNMPKEISDHTKDEVKRQAYIALMVAAFNTRKIMEFIGAVEGVPPAKMTTDDGEMVEGVGWPQSIELGALKGLCSDLIRNRDGGINARKLGWSRGARGWMETLDP